jgi:N-acyl-D-aspartate/D-glutamate deacylase
MQALRDAGVPMAVSTDLNPGTSPLQSLRMAMSLACTHFRLTPAEALRGATLHAAKALGLHDRGLIQPGLRADFNLIDPARLSVGMPQLVRDLPAGGKRFLQKAQGYIGTWVAGQVVIREGEVTGARPGRLLRMGQR